MFDLTYSHVQLTQCVTAHLVPSHRDADFIQTIFSDGQLSHAMSDSD